MTAGERTDLRRQVGENADVARREVEARGKKMLALAEEQLNARYKVEDEAWKDVTAAAERAVAEGNEKIAAVCRERGVPESFRPEMHLLWSSRGENSVAQRRAELRKAAQAKVAALVSEAQVEVDREAARQKTMILQAGLSSEEARAFIAAIPTPEELLRPLGALEFRGETILLADAATTVTPDGQAVTPARNGCAHCAQPLAPGRSDARYCSMRCRVADYRRRQAAAAKEGG
jgi:hypothetical protein